MKYCGECGIKNPANTKYCSACGGKFDEFTIIKPSKEILSDIVAEKDEPIVEKKGYEIPITKFPEVKDPIGDIKARTIWLTIVIAINYLAMGFLIIIAFPVLFESFFLAIYIFLFAIYFIWINEGLKKYDTTRRGINIGLLSVYTLFSLYTFQLILIIPAGLQIYGLIFHKPTIELFR